MTGSEVRQRIRYLRTRDGVRLAWAESGSGPTLVKASNWLTHLEFEWESALWRHWIRFFSTHFRLVRYDERGCGMSDLAIDDLSPGYWIEDFEQIVEASCREFPIVLLGISQGASAAISYAVKHPDRVSRLIVYGGYDLGWRARGDEHEVRRNAAMTELFDVGWGSDNPVFRQLFTSRFIPGGSAEQVSWFNELCRRTVPAANAAKLFEFRGHVDVRALLARVRTPTLVVHARNDQVVPIGAGRNLAAGIPGAEFVELDSVNHVLLEDEPAWERFCEVVLEFVGIAKEPAAAEAPAFAELSPRERQVLALITEGLSNLEIAERLSISEKTVRNHVSHLFDKLGVWSRAQAIVFARDRGFRG